MRLDQRLIAAIAMCATLAYAGVAGAAARSNEASEPSAKRHPAAETRVSAAAAAPDDDIPGVLTEFQPDGTLSVSGSLDELWDNDDVYKVYLYAGEVFNFALNADPGTDFGLYVYGPRATSVYTNVPDAGVDPQGFGGPSTGYPRSMNSVFVTESGYYYIDVWTWYGTPSGGAGNYTLSVKCTRPYTKVQFQTTSATTAYWESKEILGHVDSRFTGAEGGLLFYYSYDGLNYVPAYGMDYTPGTQFSFMTMPQTRKTWYMVTFLDDDSAATCSRVIVFNCYTSLGTPKAPSTMYKGKSKTVYGYLKPRHKSGTYPVRIYKYRYVSGKWKSYGYVKAKASNYSDYTKYSASVSLPYAGKWRLRAYSPSDSHHAATWSTKYDYVTVK